MALRGCLILLKQWNFWRGVYAAKRRILVNDKIYKDKDDVRSLGERESAGVSVEDGE